MCFVSIIVCDRPRRSVAGVAQLVEQLICNHQVGGSNPFTGSNIYGRFKGFETPAFYTHIME